MFAFKKITFRFAIEQTRKEMKTAYEFLKDKQVGLLFDDDQIELIASLLDAYSLRKEIELLNQLKNNQTEKL